MPLVLVLTRHLTADTSYHPAKLGSSEWGAVCVQLTFPQPLEHLRLSLIFKQEAIRQPIKPDVPFLLLLVVGLLALAEISFVY